jgi:dUTP pyrophosphatase
MAALEVKLLSERARAPTRGSALAAGYDLYSAEDVVIEAGGWGLVNTDIAVAVPPGTYGRVAPRSGLALRNGIDVGAGVVDEDYRGAVGVILFNHGRAPFAVAASDRVAQLILERICSPDVRVVSDLGDTAWGESQMGPLA